MQETTAVETKEVSEVSCKAYEMTRAAKWLGQIKNLRPNVSHTVSIKNIYKAVFILGPRAN